MSEDPRPPVAIRITRPYATEEDLLEHELETLTHTSVTLLGAQPRPQGVVLRFEVVLTSGHVAMRGEGRVVGFRPNAHQGLGGLTLRFTRLDSRSKALVDKAAALRDRRRPSTAPPHDAVPPSQPVAVPSLPAPAASALPFVVDPPAPSVRPPPQPPPLPLPPRPLAPLPWVPVAPQPPASPAVAGPPHRDALLERLRTRAKALDPAAVQQILRKPA